MNTDAKLGRELVAVLTVVAGDAGHTEGAVDCAKRIIRERNDARADLARANRRLAKANECLRWLHDDSPVAYRRMIERMARRGK